jgi:endonuclease/exonuclease/phosphatase (EEP) superfamily protein YafD
MDFRMRLVSWNVLRQDGATVEDIAALVAMQRPDLLLLQEATEAIDPLATVIGGHYWRRSMPDRTHGLALWCVRPFAEPTVLTLPFDPRSRTGDRRIAAVLQLDDMAVINVHLTHGQFLLRRQLQHIADSVTGPALILGDMNAIGPTAPRGFADVGPRGRTHMMKGILPVRIDRALVRGIACERTAVLARGRSDHHAILVDIAG